MGHQSCESTRTHTFGEVQVEPGVTNGEKKYSADCGTHELVYAILQDYLRISTFPEGLEASREKAVCSTGGYPLQYTCFL